MVAVDKVLAELNCDDQDHLVLMNKCDVLNDPAEAQIIEAKTPDCMRISALTGAGLDVLHDYVLSRVRVRATNVTIRTHAGNGQALAFLDRHAHVLQRHYDEDAIELEVRISQDKLKQLQSRLNGIEVIPNAPDA